MKLNWKHVLSGVSVAAVLAGVVACSDPAEQPEAAPTPGSTGVASTASAGAPSTAEPSPSAETASPGSPPSSSTATPTASTGPSTTPTPTSSNQPVPKVQRSGQPTAPKTSAEPAEVDETVRYADGITLSIRSISFAKEKSEGPGSFPGQEYAVLTLALRNGSSKTLGMDTVVVTVLDRAGQPVAPVAVPEARVQDFAGKLKAGASTRARYAFAVPESSRSMVTVIVDFDGVHTSAVFRGKLS